MRYIRLITVVSHRGTVGTLADMLGKGRADNIYLFNVVCKLLSCFESLFIYKSVWLYYRSRMRHRPGHDPIFIGKGRYAELYTMRRRLLTD